MSTGCPSSTKERVSRSSGKFHLVHPAVASPTFAAPGDSPVLSPFTCTFALDQVMVAKSPRSNGGATFGESGGEGNRTAPCCVPRILRSTVDFMADWSMSSMTCEKQFVPQDEKFLYCSES